MIQEKEKSIQISEIILPKDQYAHLGAPTEWWWHVGTLVSADGRKFGFEINATGMSTYAFTQIQITDVKEQTNYQKVTPIIPFPQDWTEYDQTKPWFVKLTAPGTNPSNGAIGMQQMNGTPLNMAVQASFTDKTTKTSCKLDLQLEQKGPPLLVWGTGCNLVNPEGKTPITRNNYYYSLTNLNARGTITIGGELISVTGLTWMDHEYGAFPNGSSGEKVVWLLQDIQMASDLHLSNYTNFGVMPKENIPMKSNATLLKNGESIFVDTITTPMGPIYTSKKGVDYFMKFKVEINCPELLATVIVESSYPEQLFNDGLGPDVYEGVGTFQATLGAAQVIVSGNAWIEQNLG